MRTARSDIIAKREASAADKCPKSSRCLYGGDCPTKYQPTDSWYGCFDRGRYDHIFGNTPEHLRKGQHEEREREKLRKEWRSSKEAPL